MRILHLPQNPASLLSEAIYGLNKIKGVKARGIVFDDTISIYDGNEGLTILKKVYGSNRNPIRLFRRLVLVSKYIWNVAWADVIHWYWDNGVFKNDLDLKIIRFFRKPLFIEWVGSDVRNPEIESTFNPYYKAVLSHGYEYLKVETEKSSLTIQNKFSKFGAYPIIIRGSSLFYHIDKNLFKNVFMTRHRINTQKYKARIPSAENTVPLIIHSPTARIGKGSKYVEEAIERLRKKHTFKFELLEKLTREEVGQRMESCDIYLDQFIVGGHGMAATEAMALGKPVMCYLHEESLKELPPDCPIVNASVNSLEAELEKLILDAGLRHKIGKESRKYVEKYLDSEVVARELVEIYKSVIEKT